MTRDEFRHTMEAGPVYAHLARLAAGGISASAVAALLDLPGVTASTLLHLRDAERVDYRTGAAVIAIPVPTDDRDTSWTEDAECRRPYVAAVARSYGLGTGTEMFFTTDPTRRRNPVRDAALAICGTCAVRDECLAYAMAAPRRFPESGIWGGTTDEQRKQLRRKSNR